MNATQDRSVATTAKYLIKRLHRAHPGYRCSCGQCKHLIRITAMRAAIPEAQLLAALPPVRKPKRDPHPRDHRGLTAQVGTAMTVARDGHRYDGADALLSLVTPR